MYSYSVRTEYLKVSLSIGVDPLEPSDHRTFVQSTADERGTSGVVETRPTAGWTVGGRPAAAAESDRAGGRRRTWDGPTPSVRPGEPFSRAHPSPPRMSDFDLDLRNAEEQLDEEEYEGQVSLAVLDGTTDPEEWVSAVESGTVLVLAVEGELNRLAAGFAREVRDMGGQLMHFRSFLVVTPPGVDIDTDRLG
jgi:SepF-like predicted cell division protein (DUF552 family)